MVYGSVILNIKTIKYDCAPPTALTYSCPNPSGAHPGAHPYPNKRYEFVQLHCTILKFHSTYKQSGQVFEGRWLYKAATNENASNH